MKRGFLREVLDDVARGKDLVALFMAPGRSPSQVWMALNTLVDMEESPLFRKVAAKYRVDPSYLLHRVQGLLHQVEELRKEDPYSLLGVGYTATPSEIHRRWKELMQEWHPDRRGGDPKAQEECRRINEAYELLKDQGRRREYDRRYVPLLAVLKEVGEGVQGYPGPTPGKWPRFAVLGLTVVLALVVLVFLRIVSKGPPISPSRVAVLAPAPQPKPQPVPESQTQPLPQPQSVPTSKPGPKSQSLPVPLPQPRSQPQPLPAPVPQHGPQSKPIKVAVGGAGKKEGSSVRESRNNPFLPRIKVAKGRTEALRGKKGTEAKPKARSRSPVSKYAHLSPPPKKVRVSRAPEASTAVVSATHSQEPKKPLPSQSQPESVPQPLPQPLPVPTPQPVPSSQPVLLSQPAPESQPQPLPVPTVSSSRPLQVVEQFIRAYREGDLSLLLSLFSRDARENGEPLARYIPRYRLFFKSFKVVEYRLLDRDVRSLGEEVEVRGSYLLSLVSRSGGSPHWVKGGVAWILARDKGEGWLIKSLNYTME